MGRRKQPFCVASVTDALPSYPKGRGRKANLRMLTDVLNAIAYTGTIWRSVEREGLSFSYFKKLRGKYPDLDDLVRVAQKVFAARVEDEVARRAIDGVEEPVFFQGVEVARVPRYSDTLLTMLAKRHIPAFRDHSAVDVNHQGGVLMVPGQGPMAVADWVDAHNRTKPSEQDDKAKTQDSPDKDD